MADTMFSVQKFTQAVRVKAETANGLMDPRVQRDASLENPAERNPDREREGNRVPVGGTLEDDGVRLRNRRVFSE